ncbi:UDP-N-acetylmuramate dehydrogenase [Candidatus Vallotia cooleyia]|uniref:UDP-N-acetylmuramate dehydrogenase n=1 Tax=Candidatus Vallotiella adelgis TaxID=1177211 RepID=UPI001D005D18|nr:UDP-N-acetylmuramate dehydrogenase [Candidatus Vallotia cooleyia]UDG82149.1 UDP-N-acetylenolpyruvoylglucosamine reductase [Candidatus Vallotia cooleyia]
MCQLTNAEPAFNALQANYSLRDHNTFGFDVRARLGGTICSEVALIALCADQRIANLPRLVLGAGSNVVLTRDFDGLVLVIKLRGKRILAQTDDSYIVEVAAGERWHDFVDWTLQQGMAGLENLALIPGTVGAAPVQNIGAYGLELVERLERLRSLDIVEGRIIDLDAQACAFGYRDSIFKHAARDRLIILSVVFRLPKRWQACVTYADLASWLSSRGIHKPTARQIFGAITEIRREKLPNPMMLGNAGSFFKNPLVDIKKFSELRAKEPNIVFYTQHNGRIKLAAGWMIDRCGWKGRSIGPSAVHERQALVLVNRGGATGKQILALALAIRADVRQRFGVELDIEPRII